MVNLLPRLGAGLKYFVKERRDREAQQIKVYTDAEAAKAMGIGDMRRFGQPHRSIQFRLDFARYMNELPPLGLTAEVPFSKAWKWGELGWEFPILTMQAAVQQRSWSDDDSDRKGQPRCPCRDWFELV
jgi:hypothetical protein